jgi:hypothetical protein
LRGLGHPIHLRQQGDRQRLAQRPLHKSA